MSPSTHNDSPSDKLPELPVESKIDASSSIPFWTKEDFRTSVEEDRHQAYAHVHSILPDPTELSVGDIHTVQGEQGLARFIRTENKKGQAGWSYLVQVPGRTTEEEWQAIKEIFNLSIAAPEYDKAELKIIPASFVGEAADNKDLLTYRNNTLPKLRKGVWEYPWGARLEDRRKTETRTHVNVYSPKGASLSPSKIDLIRLEEFYSLHIDKKIAPIASC